MDSEECFGKLHDMEKANEEFLRTLDILCDLSPVLVKYVILRNLRTMETTHALNFEVVC